MSATRTAPSPTWWQRLFRNDERRARTAYRRSLPPLYRWRRVAIGAAVVLTCSFAFAFIETNPVAWAKQRWYDVTNEVVQVRDTEAEALPEGSDLDGFAATNLVDDNFGTAWATSWQPTDVDGAAEIVCGQATADKVTVSFPATRLREIRVISGLSNATARSLQQLPAAIDFTFENGTCLRMPLTEAVEEQKFRMDTRADVSQVQVSIAAVHGGADERALDEVALSNIALFSRP